MLMFDSNNTDNSCMPISRAKPHFQNKISSFSRRLKLWELKESNITYFEVVNFSLFTVEIYIFFKSRKVKNPQFGINLLLVQMTQRVQRSQKNKIFKNRNQSYQSIEYQRKIKKCKTIR